MHTAALYLVLLIMAGSSMCSQFVCIEQSNLGVYVSFIAVAACLTVFFFKLTQTLAQSSCDFPVSGLINILMFRIVCSWWVELHPGSILASITFLIKILLNSAASLHIKITTEMCSAMYWQV